jgi:hypothetical protein
MKPAPPVIIMFLTSGLGGNFVVPCRRGARSQMSGSGRDCDVRRAVARPYAPVVLGRSVKGLLSLAEFIETILITVCKARCRLSGRLALRPTPDTCGR